MMGNKLRQRLWVLVVPVVFVFIVVGDRVTNGDKGEIYHQMLLHEFHQIKPPSSAAVISKTDNFSVWSPRKALIGENYMTNNSYSVLADFYKKQLQSQGWHFVKETALKDWGRNLGGRKATYCKDAMQASLQYSGDGVQYGWTYAFDISWGMTSCE